MRQVGDTLVWLAMIGLVAAVVYFTPRLASYVGSVTNESAGGKITSSGVAYHHNHISGQTH
jgi:hypothetical protein